MLGISIYTYSGFWSFSKKIQYTNGKLSYVRFTISYLTIFWLSIGRTLPMMIKEVGRKDYNFTVNRKPLLGIYPEGTEINYHSHIDMKTADGMVVPWLASQTDMLADDWHIVE